MAVVTYPVSQIIESGPRNRCVQYIVQIPAGVGISDHAFLGPIDVEPGTDNIGLHISGVPSTANAWRLTVLGSFDGASITPSARNWMTMRGDTPKASAAGAVSDLGGGDNTYLLAVTWGGHITVRGPARSFRFRVSGGPSNISNGITLTAVAIRPNY